MIKLKNKMRQGLPILLTNSAGKLVSRILPSRGELTIEDNEMSQDIHDKENARAITVEHITQSNA